MREYVLWLLNSADKGMSTTPGLAQCYCLARYQVRRLMFIMNTMITMVTKLFLFFCGNIIGVAHKFIRHIDVNIKIVLKFFLLSIDSRVQWLGSVQSNKAQTATSYLYILRYILIFNLNPPSPVLELKSSTRKRSSLTNFLLRSTTIFFLLVRWMV